MLELQNSRIPNCSESSCVKNYSISPWNSYVQKIGCQITKVIFMGEISLHEDFIKYQFLPKKYHFFSPFLIENVLHSWMLVNSNSMELKWDQFSSCQKSFWLQIFTCSCIFEYFFTNWDRSFNMGFLFVYLEIFKSQVHHIKVKSTIIGAHDGDASNIMMRKYMSMALNNSINCAFRQRINKHAYFISFATCTSLRCIFIPDSKSIISITEITNMANNKHSMGSCFSKDSASIQYDLNVGQEFKLREGSIVKSISG